MASQSIGIIVGLTSGLVYAVVNPDEDAELDNPKLLLMRLEAAADREGIAMRKVSREQYMNATSMDEVAALVGAVLGQMPEPEE